MKHVITVTIDDESLAARVYARVAGSIEDMIESERPTGTVNVSSVWSSGDSIDQLYIAKAQDEFALGSSDNVEIDDDAMVDLIEGGAWVYGRVFVADDGVIEAALDALDAQSVPVLQVDEVLTDSEGGHCD